MNEFLRNKWVFLCLAIVISFALNVLKTDATFADTTVVDPFVIFTGEADVPNPPMGVTGILSQPIIIKWDDDGDLLPISFISITAPPGLKFTNVSGNITGNTTAVTSLAGGTTTVSSLLGNDDMEIRFNVDSTGIKSTGINSGELRVGSDTPLQLCPKDDAIMAMTEAKALKLAITVSNGGTGNMETNNLGDIRLLRRPDIATVDEFSSTELQVMLKAEIGTVTVNNFYIGTSKPDRSNGLAPQAVEIDSNDMTKIKLTFRR